MISAFRVSLVSYYLVVLGFVVATFFPHGRVWGINIWAYFPQWVIICLIAASIVAPIVLNMVMRDKPHQRQPEREGRFGFVIAAAIIILTLAFILLRGRFHFLGDGYTLLSLVEEGSGLAHKNRAFGESLIHLWLYDLIGHGGKEDALLSFQLVSVVSGVLFLLTAALSAAKLLDTPTRRILLFLGIVSSGYMLNYFGYVEYYALFVLSVLLFTFLGLLVVERRAPPWLMPLALALCVFFHVFGFVLILPTLYALALRSPLTTHLGKMSTKVKLGMALATVAAVAAVIFYIRQASFYLRFAFVPFYQDQFTVEGYTLFSAAHMLDILNLLVLLVPGLVLFFVIILKLPLGRLFGKPTYSFLMVTMVVALGAVLVFDPDLGMPRDWDLFSFAGVPLAVLAYYIVLSNHKRIPRYRYTVSLAIVLGFLSLSARVIAQVIPAVSVAHFRDYIYLDKTKNRTARQLLVNFYKDRGDTEKEEEEQRLWAVAYPEETMVRQTKRLIEEGRHREAIRLCHQVLEINPTTYISWTNLGNCYLRLGQYDSALTVLKIAAGLNPENVTVLSNVGFAYACLEDYENAERAWLRAVRNDSTALQPNLYLIQLYQITSRLDEYRKRLSRVAARDDAPAEVLMLLGEDHLRNSEYEQAADALNRALAQGLDSNRVQQLKQQYPLLRPLLP